MKLVDKVAQLVYDGYKKHTKDNPNELMTNELYDGIKEVIAHKHPIDTLTLGYTVSIGDVLEPIDSDVIVAFNESVPVLPSDRYIIYSMSCPSRFFDISQTEDETERKNLPKILVLIYHNTSTPIPYDIHKVDKVMCLGNPSILLGLLQACRKVTNVARLLV